MANLLNNPLELFQQLASSFQSKDIIDILLVAVLVYMILALLKRTHSLFIFGGIIILFAVYLLVRVLNLYLSGIVFQAFITFFAVIFVVIFQRELRQFFEWVSVWGGLSERKKLTASEYTSNYLVQVITHLAQNKIGAIVVLTGEQPIDRFLEGGIGLNGKISVPLLLSIFDPSSPGHDGAVVIEGDRVKKFGVHLPLADQFEKYGGLGTRHRAGLGIAQRSDALAIVVSEERGTISLAYQGELKVLTGSEGLKGAVEKILKEKFAIAEKKPWHFWATHNLKEKILAVALSLILWLVFSAQFGAGIITRQFDVPIEIRGLSEERLVESLSSESVTLVLRGRGQDFNLLDQRGLKATVDISEFPEGLQKARIDESSIVHPTSLSVVSFSPKTIQFRIKKKSEPVR